MDHGTHRNHGTTMGKRRRYGGQYVGQGGAYGVGTGAPHGERRGPYYYGHHFSDLHRNHGTKMGKRRRYGGQYVGQGGAYGVGTGAPHGERRGLYYYGHHFSRLLFSRFGRVASARIGN